MPARSLTAMPAPLGADTRDGIAAGQYECCIWNRVIGGLTPKLAGRTRASGTRGCGGRSHSMWMGAACGTVTPGQTAIGAAIVERSRSGDPGSPRMDVCRRIQCGARARSPGAEHPRDAPNAFDEAGHRADESKKTPRFRVAFLLVPNRQVRTRSRSRRFWRACFATPVPADHSPYVSNDYPRTAEIRAAHRQRFRHRSRGSLRTAPPGQTGARPPAHETPSPGAPGAFPTNPAVAGATPMPRRNERTSAIGVRAACPGIIGTETQRRDVVGGDDRRTRTTPRHPHPTPSAASVDAIPNAAPPQIRRTS